tara:strand:- start:199 stop:480 length:282 start_codon:yes stop_codon:yes gene_type:complete
MDFNIEEYLKEIGFGLEIDKDVRTSYSCSGCCITLFWSGDMLDEDGYCISMAIDYGTVQHMNRAYFGARPTDKEGWIELLNKYNIDQSKTVDA